MQGFVLEDFENQDYSLSTIFGLNNKMKSFISLTLIMLCCASVSLASAESTQQKQTKIEKKINPFVTNPRNLLSLNDDGRKQIQELTEEFKETVSKKEQMAIELKEIRDSSREDANPMINILAAVNPRVSLNLGTSSEVTTQRKVLHCTVLENSLKGGLRFTSVYRLSSKAKDIESEIADRESQQI